MLNLLVVLILGQCAGCPPGKTKVAVFEFVGVGVEKELVTTVSDLLRVELANCDKYEVIDKQAMIDKLYAKGIFVLGEEENLVVMGMDKAIEYSDSLGVSLAVTGHMSKLGNKIIISASLINKWTKLIEFTDKVTATNVEDLDITIKRLADGLCHLKKSKEMVTVETITEEEAKPRRRRESYHTGGLLVGYLFPMGNSYGRKIEGGEYFGENMRLGDYVNEMPGAYFSYFYETPYYLGEVSYKVHQRSRASDVGVVFNGYRFLSLTDFSPYVGGGFGMSWGERAIGIDSLWYHINPAGDTVWYCRPKTESFDGLSVDMGGGIALFRTYDFHFLVNLKYHIVFGKGTPNGFIFAFGVTYKKTGGGCGCGF